MELYLRATAGTFIPIRACKAAYLNKTHGAAIHIYALVIYATWSELNVGDVKYQEILIISRNEVKKNKSWKIIRREVGIVYLLAIMIGIFHKLSRVLFAEIFELLSVLMRPLIMSILKMQWAILKKSFIKKSSQRSERNQFVSPPVVLHRIPSLRNMHACGSLASS